jgi:hypothetical protein
MKIRVYGRQAKDDSPYRLLSGQMTSSYFPVSFHDVESCVVADYLPDGKRTSTECWSAPLRSIIRAAASAIAFSKDGRKIVYA